MVTEHYIPGAPRSRIQRGKLRKGKKNDDLPMRHDRNPGRHRMVYDVLGGGGHGNGKRMYMKLTLKQDVIKSTSLRDSKA